MKDEFVILDENPESISVYKKGTAAPIVSIEMGIEGDWYLFITKELCIAKDKKTAIKIAKNTIKLINGRKNGKM